MRTNTWSGGVESYEDNGDDLQVEVSTIFAEGAVHFSGDSGQRDYGFLPLRNVASIRQLGQYLLYVADEAEKELTCQ